MPTSNVILAKLKVAINADAPVVYSMCRWSKSCETSTQRRNPLENFPVPFRRHFGTHRCDRWFWQAYRPTCTCIPLVHSSRYVSQRETLIRRSLGEVGSTAVYPPSWIRVNSVRKIANATLQFMSRPRRLIETRRYLSPAFIQSNMVWEQVDWNCWTGVKSTETSLYTWR